MSEQNEQNGINMSKIDMGVLTDLQKEMHGMTKQKSQSEGKEVESVFLYQTTLTSWGTHIPIKMKHAKESNKHVFTANSQFDFLISTIARFTLPPMVLKEQYRDRYQICWPHNIGHNRIKSCELRYDDYLGGYLNSVILDVNSQFFMKKGFDKKYKKMIGSVPALENWDIALPRWPIKVPLALYYSVNKLWAIPLCKCSKTEVKHTINTEDKILNMIRLRCKNKDGTYKLIKPKAKYFKNINKDDEEFEPLELWATYASVNEAEKENHLRRELDYMYIRDFVSITTANPYSYGQNAEIDLVDPRPCLALFWNAENQKARSNRNLSNYTSNSEDLYSGCCPISHVTMKHGTSTRFHEVPSDYFEDDEVFKHFPSAPTEPGYLACSFTYDIEKPKIDIGKSLGKFKTKTIFKMGNTDPYLELEKLINCNQEINDEDDEEEEDLLEDIKEVKDDSDKEKFKIHTTKMVVRKLKFIKGLNGKYEKCKLIDEDRATSRI